MTAPGSNSDTTIEQPTLDVAYPLRIGKSAQSRRGRRNPREMLALKFQHVPGDVDKSRQGRISQTPNNRLSVQLASKSHPDYQIQQFSGTRRTAPSDYVLVLVNDTFWLERVSDIATMNKYDGSKEQTDALTATDIEMMERTDERERRTDPDSWNAGDESSSPVTPEEDAEDDNDNMNYNGNGHDNSNSNNNNNNDNDINNNSNNNNNNNNNSNSNNTNNNTNIHNHSNAINNTTSNINRSSTNNNKSRNSGGSMLPYEEPNALRSSTKPPITSQITPFGMKKPSSSSPASLQQRQSKPTLPNRPSVAGKGVKTLPVSTSPRGIESNQEVEVEEMVEEIEEESDSSDDNKDTSNNNGGTKDAGSSSDESDSEDDSSSDSDSDSYTDSSSEEDD